MDQRNRPRRERMKRTSLQTLLSPKNALRIGNWNVRTLYETGKAAQVAREMDRYGVEVLGMSEVRWTSAGKLTLSSGHVVLYSGLPEEEGHHHGVGIMLSKEANKCLMEWEPINERLITARFKSKFQNVTMVQCYAPTNQAEQEAKDEFYGQLQGVLDRAPRRDIVIVSGDMNAKVGGDNTGRELVMGKEGLGIMNENGELFTDFCANNDLVIGGTIFSHKEIHKKTWRSPDMATENQIDHVAISRRWRRSLADVRAYRGADGGSDHELVIAKLKVKIARVKKTGLQRQPRFDTSKLKGKVGCQDFAIKLTNKFQVLASLGEGNVEEKWSTVKEVFKSTCEEVLGYRKRTHKSWLSTETTHLVDQKREIRHKLLQAKTRAKKQSLQEEYRVKQKEVKKSARRDKSEQVDQMAMQAQDAANKGDMRTLYDISRKLSGRNRRSDKPVKSLNGDTLTRTQDQLERWSEHFKRLLNGAPVADPPVIEAREDLEINTGPITRNELIKSIQKLKSNKAPGLDSIPPEALKADAAATADILFDLINDIWEQEEVPAEWRRGLIVKLPKKGDLGDCQNWRGIQLLSLPSKVLTRVILERIKATVNKEMRDEQAGFRAGRSCIDQIATLRTIVEQSLEWQSPLYMSFIDFKKAFDMVDRPTMWKILKFYGLPGKIINILRSLYENTTCNVIHNCDLSPSFEVTTGVRQGCMISPLIFSLVIDWIMTTTTSQVRGIQWTFTKQLEDLDFADDISLLSHTHQHMQDKIKDLANTAKKTGLSINTSKTKAMRLNTTRTTPILLEDQPLEEVDSFVYLGSLVNKTGGADEDIKIRIGKAQYAFNSLRTIWNNRHLRLNTKLTLFNSNVKSVLLYGSETWKRTKALDHKLQVFFNRCLRRILRIRWPDKISNQELWRRTKQKPITTTIKSRKWKWIGHILRRDQTNITRHALDWNPQGHRKKGRPVTTWRRTLDAELKPLRLSWSEAKHKAQDRTRWREVVKALCPEVGEED